MCLKVAILVGFLSFSQEKLHSEHCLKCISYYFFDLCIALCYNLDIQKEVLKMAKRVEGASVKFDGISFRLSEKERRILSKNAEKAGLSPSKYAKTQALEGKLKIMFSDEIGQDIIASLVRIENNIKKINDDTMNNRVESQFTKIQNDLDIVMDYIFLHKKPPKRKQIEEVSSEPVKPVKPVKETTNIEVQELEPIVNINSKKTSLNETQTENVSMKNEVENAAIFAKIAKNLTDLKLFFALVSSTFLYIKIIT